MAREGLLESVYILLHTRLVFMMLIYHLSPCMSSHSFTQA